MKYGIALFLILSTLTASAQKLLPSTARFLDLPQGVVLSQIVFDSQHIIGVGQQRNGKELDAYLLKCNKEGLVVSQKTFGAENSFDRASGIVQIRTTYWILLNSLASTQRETKLCAFDSEFNLLETIDLSDPQTVEGISLTKVNDKEIAVLLNYEKTDNQVHPLVVKYNLETQKSNHISLDFNNNSIHPRLGVEDTFVSYIKVPVGINVINDKLFITGSEDTANTSDNWVSCINMSDEILWDKLIEKFDDPGGDFLIKALDAGSGQTALIGQHYNKHNNLVGDGYDFNFLLIDREGQLLVDKSYTLGQHEWICDGHKMGKHFLLSGHAVQLDFKNDFSELNSNLYFVLVNHKGEKLTENIIQNSGMQKMIATSQMSNSEIVSIYEQVGSERDGLYIQAMEVVDGF